MGNRILIDTTEAKHKDAYDPDCITNQDRMVYSIAVWRSPSGKTLYLQAVHAITRRIIAEKFTGKYKQSRADGWLKTFCLKLDAKKEKLVLQRPLNPYTILADKLDALVARDFSDLPRTGDLLQLENTISNVAYELRNLAGE